MTTTRDAYAAADQELQVTDLGTVMSIWAHPDDETYLAGGVMAATRDAGGRVVCVTATRGEAADEHATPADRSALAAVRTDELSDAFAALGIEEHHWLDLPDGGLEALDPAAPVAAVVALLDDVRPDTVLTFGPDGVTGHPDHRTVHRWVTRAVGQSAADPRILHPVATGRRIELDLAREFDMWVLGGPRQCPGDKVALRVELDGPELDRKIGALRAQRSQTAGLISAIGLDRYRTWVSVETYAHPG
ncbi:PIG-L deacetylase family protein [Gordonia sp. NPDC058843]|uniref:PIG-L deacetylase family protein n=1 Tax=Gordonia sp. NPDC058843 TaxID=3346648 RepID=UPI0036ADE81F